MVHRRAGSRGLDYGVASPEIGRDRIADAPEVDEGGAADMTEDRLVRVADTYHVRRTLHKKGRELGIAATRVNSFAFVQSR